MLKKTILVDPAKCLHCSDCWVACKDEHCDNDWSPVAAIQGPGQWWVRVDVNEAGSGHHMKVHRVPVMCQQCGNAPCKEAAAAAGAPEAVYEREDGILIIDPVRARGHREIADACPYGAIYWNDELELPQKCTMCAHLLDAGRELPRCVAACPADALCYVDVDEGLAPDRMYAPLERLHPEYGTKPQVAYVNLPKLFIAGECAGADLDDCVEDCEVTATHQVTGRSYTAWSGSFGDFHIDVDEPGFYTIMFKADGYKRKFIRSLDIHESLSVDVVRLHRMAGVLAMGAPVTPAAAKQVAEDEVFEFTDPRTPYDVVLRSPLGDKDAVFKLLVDNGAVDGCLYMDGNSTDVTNGVLAEDGSITFDTQVNTPLGCLDAHLEGTLDEIGLRGNCTTMLASFVVFPAGEDGPEIDMNPPDGSPGGLPDLGALSGSNLQGLGESGLASELGETGQCAREGEAEMADEVVYECTLKSPLGKVDAEVVMHVEGGVLTGQFKVDKGTNPIENGTMGTDGSFEFDSKVESPVGTMDAHVAGTAVDGKLNAEAKTRLAKFTIFPRE